MSNEASQNNRYNKLIAILAEKFGLTGKEIADIFWLTLKRQEDSNSNVNIEKINDTPLPEVEEESNSSQSQQDSNSKQNISTSSQSSSVSSKSTPKADIIPEKSTSSGKNIPLRVSDAPSLRESLQLARSLKSFQTLRIDSVRGLILDDTKSAERTAAEGFLALVLKPELEALFELALVVDESKSMLIWRHTINELKTLLQGSGFFRDVRTWGLVTDDKGKISFRPGIGKTANKQRSASHRELIDPEGRRLILVVSDCVAAIWRNGAVNSILKDWTKSQPVAIVQMLPDWLWLRTGLASGASVILGSLAPVMRNKSLLIKELLLWKDIDLDRGIKVPVLTLDPKVALNWSQMVAGKSDANTSGFVFPEELKVKSRSHSQKKPQKQSQNQSQNKSQNQKTSPDINPEQRVERFRMTASPMARKLAGLLAAAPVINLPVVRLIQENLLRESRQVHVAEVFLGGLLRPLDEIETDTNPDRVHYDFMHDEIRNILLAGPAQDSVNVLDIVSKHVADNLGKSVKDFVAYLKAPETTEKESDRKQVKAFAEVTTQILKQLGGDYAAFARELEGESPESKENKPPDNQDTPRETEELLQIIEKAATEGWTQLDLSGRELTALPPQIGQLNQLKKLIIGKYELDRDGDILSFTGNKLSALPPEIGLLIQLEELQVFANQLTSLPTEIAQLTNLQILNLGSNQLSSIPAEIFKLTNLQELDLCGNELTALPPHTANLTQLKKLILGRYECDKDGIIVGTFGNTISILPAEIGLLTQLEELQIVGNQLSSLPVEIAQLTNLQILYLDDNQLSSLPVKIAQLTNLQELSLYTNQLSSLPAEIGQLTNLQELYLKKNQLSSLPTEIGQLTNLQELGLSENQLSSLPTEIGQLTNLQKLGLSENQLSSLPTEIGQLTNLQSLGLSENQLSSLPTEIGQLTNLQELNLYKNQLSSLPTEIGQLTNLQDLRLSDNQLSSLPTEIGQLTNLQYLYLYYNQLSSLPVEIWQLTNLQILYIYDNQLSSLPVEIGQLTTLQELSLSSNQLISLPLEIGQLTNLQSLYLNENHLSSLPAEIGQLTNLQELYLSGNQLSSLPAEIGQLTNLQTLYLNENQLSSLPVEIGQLTNLQTLYLWGNQLSSLPEEIWQLTNLQKLLLNSNQLSSLPTEIGQLTNLQTLSLWGNQLSSLPEEIWQLTNLQELNLYKNQLSSLPTEIGQLTNLQDLRLSDNQLSSLPVGIGQLTNLQELYLYNNQLSSLPTEIGQLTNLQTLSLYKNQLSSLPEEIWQLTNLQILELGSNQLSSLPVEIFQLTNLQHLAFLYNKMSSLPVEIGQLTNLQYLNLYANQLSSLPGSIRKLTKLEKLDLRENPIPIPAEILEGDAKEILDFYFRVQDFQILVDRNKNIRAFSEQGEVSGKLQLEMDDIELTLERIESNQTNDQLLKTLGKQLYQALFPNDINAQFHEKISSAQANQYGVVHLRLRFESPELAALPWEFLYYEENNTFLAKDQKIVLSRYIDVPEQKRDIKAANQPLKILLVISTPTDLPTLDATGEENLIREALKKHIEADRIELDVLTEATTRNIRRKLDEKPYNVFHFIGHGTFKDNTGNIALVDEDGKAKLLDNESFANFFLGDHNLGLIVLNCCQGGTLSANQAFAGTVLNLVQRGIPAVVAMQYEISDSTAKLFADEFYSYLAQGDPVDAATQKTRNAISQEVGLDRRDFATPVLYVRAKDGKIFDFDGL